MLPHPFALVSPSTRGLSLALTRYLLRTTKLPVYATYRSGSAMEIKNRILSPQEDLNHDLDDVNPDRLHVLPLDLEHDSSIRAAATDLRRMLPENSYLHTAFFTGGILHPERQPGDLDSSNVQKTFQINVISHLMLMKYFSPFLPTNSSFDLSEHSLSKWVHVTARVGSIADNKTGGWYSYRSSKAALNQAVHTFDLHLQHKKIPALCVAMHPGTMKTELSRSFWKSVPEAELYEPEYAAEKVVERVNALKEIHRGKVWDCGGRQVPW